ncbi:MAG: glutamate formimidoyltransferase [Acidimicrobiia bacterium]|nr:glutamate formimidoyltransferase [Acidimicrobiia bacterium]
MKTLVECVANFSEGSNLKVIDAIVSAIRSVEAIQVLDLQMDVDHHRSVVTFAGPKEHIGEAALRGIGKAAELIDLNRHTGKHPRIGAADVVPFVPLRRVTLQDCAAIAHHVGEQTWLRFQVPVYFYEAAAKRPDRIRLENIRRGQFEGLRQDLAAGVDRQPDVGGRQLHPTAGATAVGARNLLIAYNINLQTPDVAVARAIAKTLRESGGGLPHVKALGIELKARQQAQVSMNLTDFEKTPVHQVFERVRLEAQKLGVAIASSQLIGLIPRRAVELAAAHYLQIEDFEPDDVLENRLAKLFEEDDAR